jgi:hypothetical protein
MRPLADKFHVAFSFAGEQRELVRAIAEAVEAALGEGTVFFDEWYEPYLAGADADLKLQKIYGEGCSLAVVCVSERYGGKAWTQAEHEAIRARLMKARASPDPRERDTILPIRVGEGEVAGILFTAIVPDVRTRPVPQAAELILERLYLVRPDLKPQKATETSAGPSWPKEPVPFKHGLADRTKREWPAVLLLLTAQAARRILIFKGPSGFSKSALLQAAERYARLLRVPKSYVDFKDSALLNEANVLAKLAADLGHQLPGFAAVNTRFGLSRALRATRQPLLILLDTYERAAETKELREWIETQLLAEAEECEQLRFLVAGQKVPDASLARWQDCAETVELDRILDLRAWKDWVHAINPNVDEKHIESIVVGTEGVPSTISTILGTFAKSLTNPA